MLVRNDNMTRIKLHSYPSFQSSEGRRCSKLFMICVLLHHVLRSLRLPNIAKNNARMFVYHAMTLLDVQTNNETVDWEILTQRSVAYAQPIQFVFPKTSTVSIECNEN